MKTIKVRIPLFLDVVVEFPEGGDFDEYDEQQLNNVAISAADSLVEIEGLHSPRRCSPSIYVDGHGDVVVRYDESDVCLNGTPTTEFDE